MNHFDDEVLDVNLLNYYIDSASSVISFMYENNSASTNKNDAKNMIASDINYFISFTNDDIQYTPASTNNSYINYNALVLKYTYPGGDGPSTQSYTQNSKLYAPKNMFILSIGYKNFGKMSITFDGIKPDIWYCGDVSTSGVISNVV